MAEAASLAVGTDALADGTVSGDVGDVERPSTDPRALSSLGRRYKVSLVVIKSRPPGQGSGPARPAECTARPGAHAEGMVSETAAAAAHSRPGDGSTVAHTSRLSARLEPTLGWAGNVTVRPVYGRLVTCR